MRVFAISDLHTDFRANRLLLDLLPKFEHRRDVLVVAGDIADQLEVIKDTLSVLRSKFSQVFYTPGNHELWVRTEGYDSFEKFSRVIKICDELGVRTRPLKVGGVWVVPLYSWYDSAFDFDDSGSTAELEGWADYYFCRWPEEVTSVSELFLGMNVPHINQYDAPVISLSHFLPRRDLLPVTSRLTFKGLPKVAGCAPLDDQIRELKTMVHVFGHSHINCDVTIDGVRYVQNALGYPRERRLSNLPLKLIWDSGEPARNHSICNHAAV